MRDKPYNQMTDSEKIDQLYSWIAELHTWLKPQWVTEREYAQMQQRLKGGR